MSDAHLNLGIILSRIAERPADAVTHLTEVLRLRRDSPNVSKLLEPLRAGPSGQPRVR